MLAARTEIFGDRGGGETGTNAQQRILVGGGDDDDGTAAAFFAERVEEFAHFASALANQAEDGEVGAGVAGHHANEGALTDAASTKDADALPPPAGEEGVNGADTATERIADRRALEGKRGFAVERIALSANGSEPLVNGTASAIEHAAEELFANAQGGTPSPNDDLVPETEAAGTAQ